MYNFPLSVTPRAALIISRSSSIFSPRLAIIHAAGILTAILIDIMLVLVIVLAAGILIGIHFIDVVLVASCLIRQTAFVTFTQSDAIYGDVVYRCTLDVMNRTGLSHNAWNQMRV